MTNLLEHQAPLEYDNRPLQGDLIPVQYRGVEVDAMRPDPAIDIDVMPVSMTEKNEIRVQRAQKVAALIKQHGGFGGNDPHEHQALESLKSAKQIVRAAEERGEAFSLEPLDLPSVHILIGAIDQQVSVLKDRLGVSEAQLDIARHEAMAAARRKVAETFSARDDYSNADEAALRKIEAESGSRQAVAVSGGHRALVTSEESRATFIRDAQETDAVLPSSELVDPKSLEIMAVSLETAAAVETDPIEKKAAQVALKQMISDPRNKAVIAPLLQ